MSKSEERITYEELLNSMQDVCKDVYMTAAVAEGYPFRVTFTENEQPTLLDDFEQAKQGRASMAITVGKETLISTTGRKVMTKAQNKKMIKCAEELADAWIIMFVAENWTPEQEAQE